MPEGGRVGDKAHVPADSHGCPGCPHSCIGPAVAGSPDVYTNSRNSLRVGDPGVHAACCGPNTWKAAKGSATVFINNKAAYRKDDPSAHCGGNGKLVEGSHNVFIGDGRGAKDPFYEGGFVCVDDEGKPLAGCRYVITREDGTEVYGITDDQGRTEMIYSLKSEKLDCQIIGMDCHDHDG